MTRVTDPEAQAFWRAVSRADWCAPALQRSWLLDVHTGASVRALRGQVETLLQQLEDAQIWRFDAQCPHAARLVALGVEHGSALTWPPPQRILVTGGDGGAVDPELARMAAEARAWACDNREKLARAGAAERHLFVWIDPLGHAAFASMRVWRTTPPRCCCLPPEVDVLWVGRPCRADDHGTSIAEDLWRYERRSGWKPISQCGQQP